MKNGFSPFHFFILQTPHLTDGNPPTLPIRTERRKCFSSFPSPVSQRDRERLRQIQIHAAMHKGIIGKFNH